jgi:hypothetical protein
LRDNISSQNLATLRLDEGKILIRMAAGRRETAVDSKLCA